MQFRDYLTMRGKFMATFLFQWRRTCFASPMKHGEA